MNEPESNELHFVVRPTLELEKECPILPSKHCVEEDDQEKKKQEKECKMTVTSAEVIKRPSLEDEDEGFRTPTAMDHRIPAAIQCPPAPRKPISCSMKKKRKEYSSSNCVRIDLSKEIEFMFPPVIVSDPGHKIKKPRSGSTTN